MRGIAAAPDLGLRLVVTGTHLEPQFGQTERDILSDGFTIDARVALGLGDDSPVGIARSMAAGLAGMTEAFARLRPDVVVLLGDRYEILVAAQAAMLCRIPIAHLHGGEASEGAMDEVIRHAVTKMAHLHFAAAEPYARRIIQMGEAPGRVFTVGAMALDVLAAQQRLERAELERRLGLSPGARYFLVTYHPATLDMTDPGQAVHALAEALDGFTGHHVIVTGVNADPGHDAVARAMEQWRHRRPGMVRVVTSLGQVLYAAAMGEAEVVVGNSSSGIIEAPYLGTPTVNLGSRQQGRIRAASVIDCTETAEAIRAAVARAMDPAFRAQAAQAPYPFGAAGAAGRVIEVLRTVPLDSLLRKAFHDLSGEWS